MKIKRITKLGVCKQKCIHIDKSDGLYYTDDRIVTHNSALQMQGPVNFKLVSGDRDIIGASQSLDTEILLPDGISTTKLGNLKPGDIIYSPTEGKQEVLKIFNKGKIKTWKITLSNGKKTTCSIDHLWKVSYKKENNTKIWEIVPFGFILKHPELEFEIFEI